MALKGDAGQISLLSIYQTLSLNRQSGILVIHAGTIKRKILFVPNGIRLISNFQGDPEPLRQILFKLKILTESQFQNVLSTKSDPAVPLGEFLVQRRIIDSSLVEGPIAQHVLELIFETFAWKEAKYEFHTADGADDLELFDPDSLGKRLTFQVDAIMMEVSYREDEWQRIREAFPTGQEIVAPVNPGTFLQPRSYDADLDDGIILDVKKLVDGERSVEAIGEETVLSAFESYQVLLLLLTGGEIKPLDTPELKALAEKFRKRFKIKEVIRIYEHLLEQDPDDVDTRLKLVTLLEKKKDLCPRLLDHLEFLARHYIGGEDSTFARDFLERILDFDPCSLFALENLFDLEKQSQSARELTVLGKRIVEAVKVTKDFETGAGILAKVVKATPSECSFYHELSDFYQFSGNQEKAVASLKQVAKVYENKGDVTRLRKTYERIASLDPAESGTLRKIVELERRKTRSFTQSITPVLITTLVASALLLVAYWTVFNLISGEAFAAIKPDVDALVAAESFDGAEQSLETVKSLYPFTLSSYQAAARLEQIASSQRRQIISSKKRREEENLFFGSFLVKIQKLLSNGRHSEALRRIQEIDPDEISEKNRASLKKIEDDILSNFKEAENLLVKAQSLTKSGKHKEAHRLYLKILMDYSSSPTAQSLKMPLVVQTRPPRADISINGSKVGQTPLLLYYRPFEKFSLRISKPGFRDYVCNDATSGSPCFDFTKDWALSINLKLTPAWTLDTGGAVECIPVVEDKRVYVANRRGRVLCLDTERGKTLWSFTHDDNWDIAGSLRFWKDTIYFGTFDGKFMALDKDSGALRLEIEPMGARNPSRLHVSEVSGNEVVAAVDGTRVAGVSMVDGKVSWSLMFRDLMKSDPLLYRNSFICVSLSGRLIYLSDRSGEVIRNIDLKTELASPGMEFGGSLFIADTRGQAYRIDLDSGEVLWRASTGTGGLLAPSVGDELVILASRSGRLIALDVQDGSQKWSLEVDDEFVARGIMLRNQFILGSRSGRLRCLDIYSGSFYWQFSADGGLLAPPGVGSGVLLVGSEKSTLYKFDVH